MGTEWSLSIHSRKNIGRISGQPVKDKFPDCEIGFMPPFGNFYGMDVYVDKYLTEDREIAFNAGAHLELFKMSYQDFEKLVKPKVLRFSETSLLIVV
jgi:Ala-tRNA(Pro) deacylase